MGTRAVIRLNSKELEKDGSETTTIFVTHYDGNPKVLGANLVDAVQELKGEKRNKSLSHRTVRRVIESIAHDHTVDSEFYGVGENPDEFEEVFGENNSGYEGHDIAHEYKVVNHGDKDIRVKHRAPAYPNMLDKTGGWEDVANMVGMDYTPYHIYRMSKARDGKWKVYRFGNDRATVSEENPKDAWDRGKELVEKHAPARIYFNNSDRHEAREYRISRTPV